MVLFALLRPRLSADRPGKLQHTFELVYEFVTDRRTSRWATTATATCAFFGTIFIFILFTNLIGVIPGFESPTMSAVGARRLRAGHFLLLQHGRRPGQRHLEVPGAFRRSHAGGWRR